MLVFISDCKDALQAADSTISLMVPGTLKSSDKDSKVAVGQNQQANSDINKSTDLPLQQPRQLLSSTKPVHTPTSNQLPVNPDVSSKQQGSEQSNLSASQRSKVSVTSESTQTESHHGSSGDLLGTYVCMLKVFCVFFLTKIILSLSCIVLCGGLYLRSFSNPF